MNNVVKEIYIDLLLKPPRVRKVEQHGRFFEIEINLEPDNEHIYDDHIGYRTTYYINDKYIIAENTDVVKTKNRVA